MRFSVWFRQPVEAQIILREGESRRAVCGWVSTMALAIVPTEAGFASIMVMNGYMLEDGFKSMDAAHRFNLAVFEDERLNTGDPDLERVIESCGGLKFALKIVAECRRRAEKLEGQNE